MGKPNHRYLLPLFAIVIAVASLLALLHLLHPVGGEVIFVLPDGFRGPFYMYFDRANGIYLKKSRGAWIVEVPAARDLYIRGSSIYEEYQHTTAHFADGRPLNVAAMDGASVGTTLWLFSTYPPQYHNGDLGFFVGTGDELEEFLGRGKQNMRTGAVQPHRER
jgi:hypothetical protein